MSAILTGGVIRTMDRSRPLVDVLAIEGERIAVGGPEQGGQAERIDLDGCCVLPGFTDSHVHFPRRALMQRQPRLEACRTLDEVVHRIGTAVAQTPPGRWLLGFGWRSGDWHPARDPPAPTSTHTRAISRSPCCRRTTTRSG